MQRESQIERRAVRDYLKKRGAICVKQYAPPRGIPDRLVIMPSGYVFFVEFKDKGNETSLHQNAMIGELAERGIKTLVAYSVAEVKTFCESL